MKLLGSTDSKITKVKNGGNVPSLEVVDLVLVHCNLVNSTFVPNKTFESLLRISQRNHNFVNTFNSECPEIKVWFTDQTSKLLEIEDKTNLTLIIK